MPDDDTLPPRKPNNTFRSWLPRIWAWLAEYRDYSIPVATFLLGVVLGALWG